MDARDTRRSVNQTVAALFGAIYVAVGVIGFMVDSTGFAETSGDKIFGIFEVNPLHNIAHLLIGAALLLGSRTLASARAVNNTVGAAYLALGVLGLFILDSEANILALNGADNGLHLASAALLLAVGLGADRTTTTTTTTTTGTTATGTSDVTRSSSRTGRTGK